MSAGTSGAARRRGAVRRPGSAPDGARFLRLALRLAARGEGETSPNPMVGAVLVRDGRVVGSGYHTRAGAPHAEAVALEQAGGRARGAVLYVNLEPCCHYGRTPPCVDAIVGAGVRGVVACMRDPDPRVRGKGFRALAAAGVRVRVGLLEREARRLNERFLRRVAAGRPFVTLKAGMSLDGRIATRSGESKWITSEHARAEGRALRSGHDAVMVGVNTVLRDDPRLTAGPARRGEATARLRPRPARVVLDVVLEVPGRDGRIRLGAALRELGRRGITSVLIEGGSELLGSALDERLGDRLVVFVAGRLIGGRRSLPVFGGRGAARLRQAPRLREITVRAVGPDLRVEGRLEFPRRSGG